MRMESRAVQMHTLSLCVNEEKVEVFFLFYFALFTSREAQKKISDNKISQGMKPNIFWSQRKE